MSEERIILGADEFKIEVRPITIIAKAPNVIEDIKTPDRFMIDCDMTLYHAERVKVLHTLTERLWRIVFPSYSGEFTADAVRRTGTGSIHVLGLIDLSLKLIDQKVPIGWRYPESFLHPSAQCQLAEVLIELEKYTPAIEITL